MTSLFDVLPKEIKTRIFEFDPTFHDVWKGIVAQHVDDFHRTSICFHGYYVDEYYECDCPSRSCQNELRFYAWMDEEDEENARLNELYDRKYDYY